MSSQEEFHVLLGHLSLPLVINAILLLVAAASVHLSLSPPNPPVRSDECCSGTEETDTLFEKCVQSITWCSKAMMWTGSLCNIGGLFVHSLAHDFYARATFEQVASSPFQNEPVQPIIAIGTLCVVISAALRLWCFKSLGPLFTFEITIRPEHQLVTHGPYAWVRHPSYTGVFLTLFGATLVLFAPGTWLGDYGLWTSIGSVLGSLWVVKCCFAFRGMHMRHKAEDDVLRTVFGEEWEEYLRRVPYKFIPGVI